MTTLLILFLCLLGVLVLLAATVLCFHFRPSDPRKVRKYACTNPFVSDDYMISAHRSGGGLNPEETLMAFAACCEDPDSDVSMFEFDLHITKDDELVLIHDGEPDRTSNAKEIFGKAGLKVEELTLAELKRLNMGAGFIAPDGSMPYADLTEKNTPEELKILTLGEILDYLCSRGEYRFIIEIKNAGPLGEKSADILQHILKERRLEDRAIIGSFRRGVFRYLDRHYPELKRGACITDVLSFLWAMLWNRADYSPKYAALQLPFGMGRNRFFTNLGTAKLINYAHSRNLAVQYWTVNQPEDMEYLWSIGADCIMTDVPDVARRVKGSMKTRQP